MGFLEPGGAFWREGGREAVRYDCVLLVWSWFREWTSCIWLDTDFGGLTKLVGWVMILAVDSATTPTAPEMDTMTTTIAAPATTTVADTAAAIVPNVAAPTPTSAQEIRLDSLENRILTLESEGRTTRAKVASEAARVDALSKDFATLAELTAKYLASIPTGKAPKEKVPSKGELAATPEAPLYVSPKAAAKAAAKAAKAEAAAPDAPAKAPAPPPAGAKFSCACGGWAVNAVNHKGIEWISKHQKPGCKVTAL